MKIKTKQLAFLLKNLGLGIAVAISVAACGQTEPERDLSIDIDGSSTVYPITQKVVQEFKATEAETVDIEVDFSGTGGGFKKFCAGQTDINNASRPISTAEMTTCKEAGVAYIELPIAFDAVTVVVNPSNNWVDSLTIQDLAKIWSARAEGKITRWNQVRPDFPARPLNLFAPGEDSGTFDYFNEAVIGQEATSRKDYVSSEDDTILVQGVKQDPNALGYFGLAYYEARQEEMKAVAIDNGKGAVLPTRETVEAGEYQPLSRPLFIYVNSSAAQKNLALKEFVEFYLEQAPEIVSQVGYVPLPEEGYLLTQIHFQRGKVGTVFDGDSVFNLTIGELLRQQASF
ncbi:MAG: PstS family phosphate ABC transporter substrate-binding protein [Xenococcaceae cyanobacterium MO_188.B32]|nr:PstS family phosphate ABC transporter substrate-binding protein [Xenococcaceae cyanobacterium MO_188.B32]